MFQAIFQRGSLRFKEMEILHSGLQKCTAIQQFKDSQHDLFTADFGKSLFFFFFSFVRQVQVKKKKIKMCAAEFIIFS